MILCIESVLAKAALESVRGELAGARFESGRKTAGWAAQSVKNNLQLAGADAAHARITQVVIDAMSTPGMGGGGALPRPFRPPLVSRYETGMGYGMHVDDAVMGSPPMRTDLD